MDKSLQEVIQFLKSKIDQGISASQLIVPQKFEKILLRRGKLLLKKNQYKKKNLLTKIRKDLLIDHKEYMRLTSDQEFSKFTKRKKLLKSYWRMVN